MKTSDIPSDVRAEMDGKPCEPQTFAAWLGALPTAEQERLFGAAAMQRWREGSATQREMLTQPRRALTVAEFGAEK